MTTLAYGVVEDMQVYFFLEIGRRQASIFLHTRVSIWFPLTVECGGASAIALWSDLTFFLMGSSDIASC